MGKEAQKRLQIAMVVALLVIAALVGCHDALHNPLTRSQPVPAPLQREVACSSIQIPCGHKYDEVVTGGRLYDAHCAVCHNARPLGERPFAQYQPMLTHMRTVANLTGEEHRKILAFLRYWYDVPPPTPPVEPSSKRFFYSQPINELRPAQPGSRDGGPPPQPTPAIPTK